MDSLNASRASLASPWTVNRFTRAHVDINRALCRKRRNLPQGSFRVAHKSDDE